MNNNAKENADRKKLCSDVVLWGVCMTVYSSINHSVEVNLFFMKAKEFNKGHPFSRDPKATHEFLSICRS